MNLKTKNKTSFLWIFLVSFFLFPSCKVQLNSVANRDYNTENKNILIVIPYDAYSRKTVEKFRKEFMQQAMNSKNKIDFFIVPPRRTSETLELNKQSASVEIINNKIAEVNADIVILMVSEHRRIVNNQLTHIRYLATGLETVENEEIWKSRIVVESGLIGGTSNVAKKMARKLYNQLVSDGLIHQK